MCMGRIVDYGGDRYFRDVNSFISRVKDSITHHGAVLTRYSIHNCLPGKAFTWYNDILRDAMKKDIKSERRQ
jgi:hypothetical protein